MWIVGRGVGSRVVEDLWEEGLVRLVQRQWMIDQRKPNMARLLILFENRFRLYCQIMFK